jgi:pimeloyl-ACP methyl ester carboxylesterase
VTLPFRPGGHIRRTAITVIRGAWPRARRLIALRVHARPRRTLEGGRTCTTFYLAAGPETGPLVIFVHGWPELSISWRNQLLALARLGFRAVAPDMRGYGRSSVYSQHADYAQEHIVRDMIELLDAVGREKAVWIGHDWVSPVVWNLASHQPDRCHAVASLCVPYYTLERGLDYMLTLVDRALYPESEFPAGLR